MSRQWLKTGKQEQEHPSPASSCRDRKLSKTEKEIMSRQGLKTGNKNKNKNIIFQHRVVLVAGIGVASKKEEEIMSRQRLKTGNKYKNISKKEMMSRQRLKSGKIPEAPQTSPGDFLTCSHHDWERKRKIGREKERKKASRQVCKK